MGRKRQTQVAKTYGRHRQRVVRPTDEDKQTSVFSVSGSSDHLFSSSSSASDLWGGHNDSSLGSTRENEVFGRRLPARASKLQNLNDGQEMTGGRRQRTAKRQALKELHNGSIVGKELDNRLKRAKKLSYNVKCDKTKNTTDRKRISPLKENVTVATQRNNDSFTNFSEFEDYSLIISDSVSCEEGTGLDGQQKLKRAHSTPASVGQRKKISRSGSNVDTSTPFCQKSKVKSVYLEKLKDSDLSHIERLENHDGTSSVFGVNFEKSSVRISNEESEIRDKLSLCTSSLQELCQSQIHPANPSPGLSLRNGKSFRRVSPLQNSHLTNSSSWLNSHGLSSSMTRCRVKLKPLCESLLQAHMGSQRSAKWKNITPAKENQSTTSFSDSLARSIFNNSASLFSSSMNSSMDVSSRVIQQTETSTDTSVLSHLSALQQLEVELSQHLLGLPRQSFCGAAGNRNHVNSVVMDSSSIRLKSDSDSDLEASDDSDVESDSDSSCVEELSKVAEESGEEQSDSSSELEEGEVIRPCRNRKSTPQKHVRFSLTSQLNFSNTCYELTEEGEINDWSTEDLADNLANVSIDHKDATGSDQSQYCTAESDDMEEGEIIPGSPYHTAQSSVRSESDLFCQHSVDTSTTHQSILSDADLFTQSSPTQLNKCRDMDKMQKSFSKMLTPVKISTQSRVQSLSPRSKVMFQCEQSDVNPFSTCFSQSVLESCVKIGEGVYGEVFRSETSGPVAFKVIPIEGNFSVNDEAQKTFEEILPEIVISRELSALRNGQDNRTDNFVTVNRVSCVQGKYPKELLDQWDEYDSKKGSENDRPEIFEETQLFIVFEFADGGCDLESFKFKNIVEVRSVLQQVAYSLAVAEVELEFEHRDLHWGNVLVRRSGQECVRYKIQTEEFVVTANQLHVSIIDFTLSRLKKEGCTVFCDLTTDETLFEGQGDYQFDIYRRMKENNGNDWEPFNPSTNVLWLHYLVDKLTGPRVCTVRSKAHKDIQRQLRLLKKTLLDYQSAYDLICTCDFFKS